MNSPLPWEKPRIKRIIEIFNGKVMSIKKISTVSREVYKNEIQR